MWVSVTEAEIARGFLQVGDSRKETCVCFLRNIPNINQHLKAAKAQKFIDLKKTGDDPEVDTDAQKLLKELKLKKVKENLEGSNLVECDINWETSGAEITDAYLEGDIAAAKAAEKWSGKEIELATHKTYLDNFCQRFHERIIRLVNHALVKTGNRSNQLLQQVCQHWETAKTRCKVFEGRKDIMITIEEYLNSTMNLPFVVHGTSGCGKTSILAKAAEASAVWLSSITEPIIITRFLGTSPDSSNILQVLSSVSKQLYKIFDKQWKEPEKFSDVVKIFNDALSLSSKDKPLVIYLDSLDQLYPAYQAFRLKWLPKQLSPHTKLILSVLNQEFNILDRLKQMYPQGTFVEIPELGPKTALSVVKKWLSDSQRGITENQTSVVKQALKACSLPLYARILFDQVVMWRSFDQVSTEQLQTTVKGAINRLFEQLEIKFGGPLVKHCLSFITASRNGLSETEIDHILSVDDVLLNKVYNYWKPPFRRIPPLLWSRIRADISNYIVERSADGALVVYWYHRQFILCAKERYLSEKEFSSYIHTTMADYFSGKWSNGKKKPFEYTKAQMKRFGLDDAKASEDRKVPSQPFMYQSASRRDDLRFNLRKMSELPFHLIKSRRYKDLKKEVLFNFEYILAKIRSSSVHELTQEVDFCMLDKLVKKDEEVNVLLATLRLVQPYVARFPESLPLELSGRLLCYMDKSESIRFLVKQCDSEGLKMCHLLPLTTSFETPTIGIQQNIKFRSTPPWKKGGAVTCSKDFQTLYILDLNDEAQFIVQSWDLSTNEKIRDLPVEINIASDIIFQAKLHPTKNWLIMFKYEKFKDHGAINVIDLETGEILRNMSEFVYKKGFWNPFVYMTENYIAARFGFRLYLSKFNEDFRFDLNRPSMLVHHEKFFIISQCNITKLRLFSDKEDWAVYDSSNNVTCIGVTPDYSRTFLGGPEAHIIKSYKMTHPYKGQIFKIHRIFNIERAKNTLKLSVLQDERTEKEKPSVKHIIASPDNDHFIAVYSGISDWESVLWRSQKVNPICRVTDRRRKEDKYPAFSYDGSHIVDVKGDVVSVIRVKDGQTIVSEVMKGDIRDYVVSPCSNQYALMLEKEVVIMNIGKEKKEVMSKQGYTTTWENINLCHPRQLSGLPQEKGLRLTRSDNERLELKEYPDEEDMEEEFTRPSSVMSLGGSRAEPLNIATTPDGTRSVHLYARLQVYDEKVEEIKYTPRKGDIIQRYVKTSSGDAGMSIVPIRGNEVLKDITKKKRIALQPWDRIVQDDSRSKARFKVPGEAVNCMFIEKIPSLVRVKSTVDKDSKSVRITTCGEEFSYVSNKYLVTVKSKHSGSFVNVYDLSSGLTVATHNVAAECVMFSPEESILYVVDTNHSLRVYPGPHFGEMKCNIPLGGGISEDDWRPVGFYLYSLNQDLVTVYFKPLNLSKNRKFIYVTADIVKQKVIYILVIKTPMEDFSKDGTKAISQDLNIYDVPDGVANTKLHFPYWDENSQIHARFSDDNKLIYLTDKKDNSLFLYKRNESEYKDYQIVFRCHTHGLIAPLTDRFYLRFGGRVVVTEGSGLKMLVLYDKEKEGKPAQLSYDSELMRAMDLYNLL